MFGRGVQERANPCSGRRARDGIHSEAFASKIYPADEINRLKLCLH